MATMTMPDPRHALAILSAIGLIGCGESDEPLITPLTAPPLAACHTAVTCRVFDWRIGFKFGPSMSGVRFGCRCEG